jgi:DNA primase
LTWRQPKWKRYGSCGLPYTCGTGDVAVVVEDCISAAVAGDVKRIVGVALLGTSLLEEHKQYLMQFSKVVMALDPDATRKTIEYQKQLRSYVETVEVLKLNDDIKYRNPEDMKKIGDL